MHVSINNYCRGIFFFIFYFTLKVTVTKCGPINQELMDLLEKIKIANCVTSGPLLAKINQKYVSDHVIIYSI